MICMYAQIFGFHDITVYFKSSENVLLSQDKTSYVDISEYSNDQSNQL